MRTIVVACLVAALSGAASAADVDLEAMSALTGKYVMCLQAGEPGTDSHRFIYTHSQARLFVFKVEDGELVKDWETTTLGSKAAAVFVTDLYGDGGSKLVIGTERGRVLFYDMETYDLEWENLELGFGKIDCMAHANLDDDPQHEVVVIGNTAMSIFDSLNRTLEWVSDVEFSAQAVVVDNVDDDPQLEIILNTGRVLDSRFYNIDFEADGPFGDRISLFDINNDGYKDVFGEFSDFSIRVYDIWSQRELW